MGKKRRTRKDKENARHDFLVSWEPDSDEAKSERSVKGQFKNSHADKKNKTKRPKKAKTKAKGTGEAAIKRDIVKSLGLAFLIISLEIMIYLVWPR